MTRSIKLLGSLAIAENDSLSPLCKNAKGCALLTYLIVTKKPQTREHIADLLWEARSTAQSLGNLRVMLSRIRSLLPELLIGRRELAFQPDSETEVDFLLLTEALTTADTNTNRLAAVLPLYEGPLLAGFHLENSPRFNEWLLVERERLQHRVINGYNDLCARFSRQQAHEKGLEAARQWLTLDDLDERAHRWCIKFLVNGGNQTAALQQYEVCRRRLWQELRVEPEAATSILIQQVQAGRKTAVLSANLKSLNLAELSEPDLLPQNAMVPHRRNDDFVGREESLRALAEHLLAPTGNSPPVVAITGMGGIGKTQLAVEFCYRYGRYFPGGIYWLSFANAENVAEEVAATGGGRGMGLYCDTDQLTLADQVGQVQRAWQETVPRLLIFDNCEEETLLANWLPVTGGCRVLLTSRRANWSRDLHVSEWPLAVLDPPESGMFLQKLVPELSKKEATEIAAELGHLPLALHLAGGFLGRYRQITPTNYLNQLRNGGLLQHPSLQGRGLTQSPTNHDLHVARTFALNLTQLNETDEVDKTARQLLARAACFAPGEPIPQSLLLATNKADEDEDLDALLLAEDGLIRLVVLGFLETKGYQSVVMHRLLAAFAQKVIEDDEDEQALHAVERAMMRQLSFCLNRNKFVGKLPFSPVHLRFVTGTALKKLDAMAAQLATVLGGHLREVGEFEEAKQVLEKAIFVAEKSEDSGTKGIAGVLLTRVLESQGNLEAALQSVNLTEGWIRQAVPSKAIWLAEALNRKGWIHFRLGQAKSAREAAQECQLLGEKINDLHIVADSLNLQGVIAYYYLAKFDVAESFLKRALTIYHEDENRFGEGTVLTNLGEKARLQGDYEQAADYYQRAIDAAQETGNRTREMIYLNNLSTAQVGLGQYDKAIAILTELIQEGPRIWRVHSEAHRFLAEAYLEQGELTTALEMAKQALAHGQTANNPYDIGEAWRILGCVGARFDIPISLKESDVSVYSPTDCFQRSLEVFIELDLDRNRAFTLWNWADYEVKLGNVGLGKQMWQEAYDLFESLNMPLLLARMGCKAVVG